jgi:diguanylate cyclase (GGDEF)-like protein
MTDYEKNKDLQQNQILHIVKIAALFFSAVAFFQYQTTVNPYSTWLIKSVTLAVALIIVLIIYIFWSTLQAKIGNNYIFKTVAEPAIFMAISLLSVLSTGGYESNYKYLFLFVIISSSIECDMRGATITAAVSSLIILAIDLISAPHLEVNTYFESDFVLVCAFLIIAWTISFYVRMERSHIDSLKGLVNLDGLTGLYNHRYFYESLKREMKEAKENDTDLSLLFLDIDYFKNYNDINGHQRGDEVLKVLAKLLLGNVREQDIVSRYGGEEFSVVLPGVSEQEALQVAERLRQVVQEQHFRDRNTCRPET